MFGISRKTFAALSASTSLLLFTAVPAATAASGDVSSGAQVTTYKECSPSGVGTTVCLEEFDISSGAATPTGGNFMTWTITTTFTEYASDGTVLGSRTKTFRYTSVIQHGQRLVDKLYETGTYTNAVTGTSCTYTYDELFTDFEVRVDNFVTHCTG